MIHPALAWNSRSGVGWTQIPVRCGPMRYNMPGGTERTPDLLVLGPITCALPSCRKTFQEYSAASLATPAFHRLLPSALLPSSASTFCHHRLLTTHHSRRHLPWTQPQQLARTNTKRFFCFHHNYTSPVHLSPYVRTPHPASSILSAVSSLLSSSINKSLFPTLFFATDRWPFLATYPKLDKKHEHRRPTSIAYSPSSRLRPAETRNIS